MEERKYVIKAMESEDEITGKGAVHYKSWHETYTGLVDAAYIEKLTLENVSRWPTDGRTISLSQRMGRRSWASRDMALIETIRFPAAARCSRSMSSRPITARGSAMR